jgi:hypothetical protein
LDHAQYEGQKNISSKYGLHGYRYQETQNFK